MVPEHVAREAGGKLTRYATTEEDEATLRELLLRYVRHPSDAGRHISLPPLLWLYCIIKNLCVDVSTTFFHLGLASQISCIADM